MILEKNGKEKAIRMTRLLLKNCTCLALINPGQYELECYRNNTREKAEEFSLRFEEINDSTSLIEKMPHRPWDEEFVVVEPSSVVTYANFIDQRTSLEGI